MKFTLIAGAAALAMLSGGAFAQSVSTQSTTIQTPAVTTGPAGSFSETKTEHKVDADGTQIDKKQSVDKTQSYGSTDGQLNSTTSSRSSSEIKVAPPAPTTTTRSTTTIIEK
jgi:hypothetical protein